jgi:menaquinone-dependent protoporphyrinogen oxidase
MKTLILYASKYGAAAEIARRIAERLEPAELADLTSPARPRLEDYDRIILGGSVYAGSLRKEARAYAAENAAVLKTKTLGLFLACLAEGDGENYFTANFPPELINAAKAKALLGGVFDPAKTSWLDTLILKLVTKKKEYYSTISGEKIAAFTSKLEAKKSEV